MCSRPGPRSSSSTKARPSTISVVVAAVRPGLEAAAEDGVDEEEGEDRAERRRQPGRDREGGQRPQQAAAVERPVGGRQGEHEGGDADRQEGGQGEVAGEEGEGEAGHRDEQDQGRRVDGLGQVEAAEAVDVAGDPPALADRLAAGARTGL